MSVMFVALYSKMFTMVAVCIQVSSVCYPFVSVFHISSIIFCIIVTNLALWLQDLNKLTYLLLLYLANSSLTLILSAYSPT